MSLLGEALPEEPASTIGAATSLSGSRKIFGLLLLLTACGPLSSQDQPGSPIEEVSSALTTSLWASPSGNGTLCSQSAPCSITQAQSKVRTLTATMTGNIVVNLLDGTYPLASTLSFGAADSGTHGFYVIWQAAPNATPTLSGGTQIVGWTATPSKPGAFQATVGTSFNTRQLYVNGTRMPRAGGRLVDVLPASAQFRKTITGYTDSNATMAGWRNRSNIEFEYDGSSMGNHFQWSDSRCPIASVSGTAITMANPCWGNFIQPQCTDYFTPGCIPWATTAGGWPTRVENAYELLDEPGEWYLDRGAGILYYMPLSGQNLTAATVVAPMLETLLNASGTLDAPVHHLQFNGLTFAYATWLRPGTSVGFSEFQANFTRTDAAANGRQGGCHAMGKDALGNDIVGSCPFGSWTKTPANVTFHAAQNVTLAGDTFKHLGGAGVGFEYGSTASTISGCTFTDISATGIQLGGTDDPAPSDPRATVGTIVVSNNYIHDLPVEYLGGLGIFVGYTQGVTIQNNQISNTPYSGMSIGWGGWERRPGAPDPGPNRSRGNVVQNNHIFNVLQVLSDGGPLYSNGTRGTSASDGDVYGGNHFHSSLHASGHGVYDDIGSRFITISKQVVYDVPSVWGGCATYGDLTFTGDGFWAPRSGDPDFFGCAEPGMSPARICPSSFGTNCSPAVPAVLSGITEAESGNDCEARPNCASIIALAGPTAASASILDGRGERVLLDDAEPGIIYAGAWTADSSRQYSDLRATLHYTLNNGDSFSHTFNGTGIDYIAELDTNRGKVAISVDGVPYSTVTCRVPSPVPNDPVATAVMNQVVARVRGLVPGSHTIRGVKVDGTYMSLDALRVYAAGPEGRPGDDTQTAVNYSGASWNSVTRSTFGEFQNTLHYATANGDFYTVSFVGTGAALLGDRDSTRGLVDITVDGILAQRIDASTGGGLSTQQVLFSVRNLTQGPHTIAATKRGGTFMDIDRVDIYDTQTFNDDDAAATYVGSQWTYSNNRPGGDFNADVHFTQNNGDSAAFTFNGTGVDFIGETNVDRGAIDVAVDGIPRGRIYGYSPSLLVQQTLYRLHGLALGLHVMTLTKRSGSTMGVDAFRVIQ